MARFLAYIILTILTKLYRRTDHNVNLRLYFKFLRARMRALHANGVHLTVPVMSK